MKTRPTAASIVGYGACQYTSDSGHSGKACLYFKRASDRDLAVLETLVAACVAELRTRSVGR